MFEFACLPFGLSSAPRIFTKLMKPVVAQLRKQGIRLIIDLDDILIMSKTLDLANQHAQTTCTPLKSGEVKLNSNPNNRIPAIFIKLPDNVLVPPSRQGAKSKEGMPKLVGLSGSNSARVGQGSRSSYRHHSSCVSSSSALSALTRKRKPSSVSQSVLNAISKMFKALHDDN